MTQSRRHFLLGSGSAMALSSLPLGLQAREQLQRAQVREGLVVYRDALVHGRYFAAALAEAGMDQVVLAEDPVWQWRAQLAGILAARPVPLYGLSTWSDYQLMRGLSAELRRFPKVEVAHRIAVDADSEWAVKQAMLLLDHDPQTATPPSTAADPDHAARQTLFSWVIA